ELERRDDAVHGRSPPHERLGADEAPIGGADLGLVVEYHLASLERFGQRGDEGFASLLDGRPADDERIAWRRDARGGVTAPLERATNGALDASGRRLSAHEHVGRAEADGVVLEVLVRVPEKRDDGPRRIDLDAALEEREPLSVA